MVAGGQWRNVIGGALRAQSLAATNRARLLLEPASVVRIEPSLTGGSIELDDYRRAVNERLPVVDNTVMANRHRVKAMFLSCRSDRFTPVPWVPVADSRPEAEAARLAG